MKNEINEIKDILERMEQNVHRQDRLLFPKILQILLVDRFKRYGARYNSKFVNFDRSKGEYKKFFAFKEDDVTLLTLDDIFKRADRIERLLQQEITDSRYNLEEIEFNFVNVENLRWRHDFSDLIRGTFLWRAVHDE